MIHQSMIANNSNENYDVKGINDLGMKYPVTQGSE
jgi:hypothetical protein